MFQRWKQVTRHKSHFAEAQNVSRDSAHKLGLVALESCGLLWISIFPSHTPRLQDKMAAFGILYMFIYLILNSHKLPASSNYLLAVAFTFLLHLLVLAFVGRDATSVLNGQGG